MKTTLSLLLLSTWCVTAGTIFDYPPENSVQPGDILNVTAVDAFGNGTFHAIQASAFEGSMAVALGVGAVNTNTITLNDATFPPSAGQFYGNAYGFPLSGQYAFCGMLTNVDSSLSYAWQCPQTWTNDSGPYAMPIYLVLNPVLNLYGWTYNFPGFILTTNASYMVISSAPGNDVLAWCAGGDLNLPDSINPTNVIGTTNLWFVYFGSGMNEANFSGGWVLPWKAPIRSSYAVTITGGGGGASLASVSALLSGGTSINGAALTNVAEAQFAWEAEYVYFITNLVNMMDVTNAQAAAVAASVSGPLNAANLTNTEPLAVLNPAVMTNKMPFVTLTNLNVGGSNSSASGFTNGTNGGNMNLANGGGSLTGNPGSGGAVTISAGSAGPAGAGGNGGIVNIATGGGGNFASTGGSGGTVNIATAGASANGAGNGGTVNLAIATNAVSGGSAGGLGYVNTGNLNVYGTLTATGLIAGASVTTAGNATNNQFGVPFGTVATLSSNAVINMATNGLNLAGGSGATNVFETVLTYSPISGTPGTNVIINCAGLTNSGKLCYLLTLTNHAFLLVTNCPPGFSFNIDIYQNAAGGWNRNYPTNLAEGPFAGATPYNNITTNGNAWSIDTIHMGQGSNYFVGTFTWTNSGAAFFLK